MSKRRQSASVKGRQSHDEERGVDRLISINLSDQDIEYITRAVATEVPEWINRRHPDVYRDMVGAVTDTITNRLVSGHYGKSIAEVLNQPSAFTKINGPVDMEPYGSVQNTPRASATARQTVYKHLAGRNWNTPSIIGGYLDYANPFFSSAGNLRRWINPMIADGALKLGIGQQVHYHGLAPGNRPAPNYVLRTPKGFMDPVEPNMDHSHAFPVPKSRDEALARMAGDSLLSQGLLDLSGRTGGVARRPVEPDQRYGGPDIRPMPGVETATSASRSPNIRDWPDVGPSVRPSQRSTAKGDRLRGSVPIEERLSAEATPTLTDDQLHGLEQYRQRLAYEHAMAPSLVEAQPVRQAPSGRLPSAATTPYASPILPSPQDEYGYARYPAMPPVTQAGTAPGGMIRSGGFLGTPGGLGALLYGDVVAARGRQVEKPRTSKRRTLGPGLY